MSMCEERYGSGSVSHRYTANKEQQFEKRLLQHSTYFAIRKFFLSAFLPHGYPDSVSSDYLAYQIWDTVQAFCSSITGTLATHAVLKGAGVGDGSASVLAATMTWLLRDGTGMVGRIVFAWLKGSSLDCDAKKWRLFADILNDIAICLDLVAPLLPSYFVAIVCVSSISKSIVGVAGGSTRAALTQHQAKQNNMADVSAKDGNQETLVNLTALLVGLVMMPSVAGNLLLTWILFVCFTGLHLFANFKAVSSVVMSTLNTSRLQIVVNHYLETGEIGSPEYVNQQESVFLGWPRIGSINIGVPFGSVVASLA
ncbi:RUS family member 1-like isoform X2 [Corticium candelabrum]|uniref:RUS family member 1-like isoform X2 n=1 Tax=Corticium candelabrum TaxID=121492 RepID=UPI002E253E81|nr:RUS family member 1-like isoform X2 [Corticium candelabrum]